jgi:hypothetical protein
MYKHVSNDFMMHKLTDSFGEETSESVVATMLLGDDRDGEYLPSFPE